MARARLAVCAVIAAFLLGAAPSAAAPGLRLLRSNPVAVKAVGFHSRESVRITVWAGHRVTRGSARADAGGGFTASIRGAVAPPCVSLVVTAIGSDGSRATFRRYPLCSTRGG